MLTKTTDLHTSQKQINEWSDGLYASGHSLSRFLVWDERCIRDRGFREAHDCLLQLGINLVGYRHHVDEQKAEIHDVQIGLQGMEQADLQPPLSFAVL